MSKGLKYVLNCMLKTTMQTQIFILEYIHSLCFKSNTVNEGLVTHLQNFVVVAYFPFKSILVLLLAYSFDIVVACFVTYEQVKFCLLWQYIVTKSDFLLKKSTKSSIIYVLQNELNSLLLRLRVKLTNFLLLLVLLKISKETNPVA